MSLTLSPAPALSTRFGLVSAIPGVALVAWLGFLVGTDAIRGAPDVGSLASTLRDTSIAHVTAIGLLGIVVGSLLHPFQFSLVRLVEGYWQGLPLIRHLEPVGVELNRRRLRSLRRSGRLVDMERQFPPSVDELLPTRVGNAMRAAERTAGSRYGFDAIVMWPRLFPLLAPRVGEVLEDLRTQLDIAARYCALLWLVTLTGTVTLATDGWWLLLPAATLLLSWGSYRATFRAALGYGEGLRIAFDLHHADLVHALGWRVPEDLEKLVELSRELEDWLFRGARPPDNYVGPSVLSRSDGGRPLSMFEGR